MNNLLAGIYFFCLLSLLLPWIKSIILSIGYLFFSKNKKVTQSFIITLSSITALASLVLPFIVYAAQTSPSLSIQAIRSFSWASFGDIIFSFGILIDPTSAIVAATVGIVSLAIQIFSTWYLREDSGFVRYFIYLNLFIGAMFGLVVSSNLLQLFLFWEIMGVCSFFLIGFWYQEKKNIRASLKAFLTTRLGDLCLMMGIIALLFSFQSLDITSIIAFAESRTALSLNPALITTITMLLFIGVIGKSAQFPLHIWLPDAMAGPTPASALIHAATMVAAGVFLLIRIAPVFALSAFTLTFITLIGSITIVVGALLACYQDNIKKVLAYSTISQLGYMVTAAGIQASKQALFHLLTHAFFKALLFLAAGVIIHTLYTEDVLKISPHIRKTKIIFAAFLVGAASLIGLPPFSGFWSKDAILESIAHGPSRVAIILSFVGVFLTALYSRQLLLFLWNNNTPKESTTRLSGTSSFALIYLTIGAIVIGLIGTPFLNLIGVFLHFSPIYLQHSMNIEVTVVTLALAFLGIWYGKKRFRKNQNLIPLHYLFRQSGWNLSRLAGIIVGNGAKSCSIILSAIETHLIDRLVIMSYRIFRKTATFCDFFDIKFIDNIINLNSTFVTKIGKTNELIQNGKLQFYLLFLILTSLIFFSLIFLATLLT